MPDFWALAAVLAKITVYFGVLTGAGLVMIRCLFASLVEDIGSEIRSFAALCLILGVVASVASFVLRGAALTGDASGLSDPAILGMMWQTPVGTALEYRIAGVGLMLFGVLVGGWAWWLALAGAGAAIWSFSTIGHVADDMAIWAKLVLFLHLSVVCFWIGILMPLGKLAGNPATLTAAGTLGDRFGYVASWAIPVLLVAGLFLTWNLVGSWSTLYETTYGRALLVKLTFVAGLLGLGALNKLRFVPRLLQSDIPAGRDFMRVIYLEWVAFALVFGATAALTTSISLPSQ